MKYKSMEKIYEFITPSDPITFKAENDKVAFTWALLLGNGKAGCRKYDKENNQVSLPTMLAFSQNLESEIKNFIGGDFKKFIDNNKQQIKDCFLSFSYGDIEDRKTYDDACNAITEANKLKEFKAKHENRNRTSLNTWVKTAWNMAEKLK